MRSVVTVYQVCKSKQMLVAWTDSHVGFTVMVNGLWHCLLKELYNTSPIHTLSTYSTAIKGNLGFSI